MTHEWKSGDFAMVEIGAIDLLDGINGNKRFRLKAGKYDWDTIEVRGQVLRPLPASNPHQALRDAVVEATMMRRKGDSTSFYKLNDAINALRAALTPPKPVNPMEALRNAWEAPRGMMWAEGVQDALDAAEKAWKEKT